MKDGNKCKKSLPLDHYYINPHGEYFKLCNKCVDYAIEYRENWNCDIKCYYCGDRTTKTCKSIHKRTSWCKTSQIIPRPSFDEWLITQDYDNLPPLIINPPNKKQQHLGKYCCVLSI